ncbi:MAG: GNAT family N-acetyltransferase [Armatimonadota bacterium]
MEVLPLQTPRLLLRDFSPEDREAVHVYGSDPEVCQWLDWGPNTESDTVEFLARVIESQTAHPRSTYALAITRRGEDRPFGSAALMRPDTGSRQAEIGYCLARDAWGQGYAVEAAEALLDLAFGTLKLHRVWATCDPENHGSARVLEKLGMRREGYLLEHRLRRGEWRDSLLFALLKREWPNRAPGRATLLTA